MTSGPIFIIGCPRSGTGLVRDLLRSHPRLTFPYETHYLPRLYRAFGDPSDAAAARRLARTLLAFHRIRRWGLDLAAADFAECRSFRAVMECLYGAWARRERKPRWGDKTPGYALEIPTLHEIAPDARFVHVIRDGRDVALSLRRVGFGPVTVHGAARWWGVMVRAGREGGSRLPAGAYLELRYEALLEDPEGVMRTVCAFVGEPFDPAVLRRSSLSDLRWPTASNEVVVPGNREKWRRAMRPDERERFERAAGDLLAELGYETAGPRAPVGSLEEAVRRGLDLAGRAWSNGRGRRDLRWKQDDVRMRLVEVGEGVRARGRRLRSR